MLFLSKEGVFLITSVCVHLHRPMYVDSTNDDGPESMQQVALLLQESLEDTLKVLTQ